MGVEAQGPAPNRASGPLRPLRVTRALFAVVAVIAATLLSSAGFPAGPVRAGGASYRSPRMLLSRSLRVSGARKTFRLAESIVSGPRALMGRGFHVRAIGSYDLAHPLLQPGCSLCHLPPPGKVQRVRLRIHYWGRTATRFVNHWVRVRLVGLGEATRLRSGRRWVCAPAGTGPVSDLPGSYGRVLTRAEALGVGAVPPIFPGTVLPKPLKVARVGSNLWRGVPVWRFVVVQRSHARLHGRNGLRRYAVTNRIDYWVSQLDGTLLRIRLIQRVSLVEAPGVHGHAKRERLLDVLWLRFSDYGRMVRFHLPADCQVYP